MSPPSGASPWNGIFGRVKRSKYNNSKSCFETNWNNHKSNTYTIAIYMNMRNVHGTFIAYIHRNLETRKTLDDFFVQVRNFLLPLNLKVFWHKEERYTFFLFWLLYLPAPSPTCVAPATKVSASKRKPTVFPRGRSHLNSLTFSKSPQILRALPVRDVTRTP